MNTEIPKAVVNYSLLGERGVQLNLLIQDNYSKTKQMAEACGEGESIDISQLLHE